MRKLLALFLVAMFLLTPAPARAQAEAGIASLNIELWPEFDRPAMLVIYYVEFAAGAALPDEATLRIPASAPEGKPYVVATGSTLDTATEVDAVYRVEPDGDWLNVIIQLRGPVIIMEYYDALVRNGDARSYDFLWPGDYAAAAVTFRVQQPASALDLQSDFALVDLGIPSGESLRYFGYDAGPLDKGQEFAFSLAYRNPDDLLSVDSLTIEPSGALDETTSGRISFDQYMPWILGGAGAALVIGGLLFYFRSGGQRRSGGRARHRRAGGQEEGESGPDTYCPQCGARARAGDRFCRACGTKLRREA